MTEPLPHPTPARDAEARDRLLAQREAELARAELHAAGASPDPAQRAAHRYAAELHDQAAAAPRRDAGRHHLEAEADASRSSWNG